MLSYEKEAEIEYLITKYGLKEVQEILGKESQVQRPCSKEKRKVSIMKF